MPPTGNASAPSSSAAATTPTGPPPLPTRPALRAGKKGVPRPQHRLPRLPQPGPLPLLPEPVRPHRLRRRPGRARLLPPPPLPSRPLPLGPRPRPGRRPPQPRHEAAGRPGRDARPLRASRGRAAPPGRSARLRRHLPPGDASGRRPPAPAVRRRGRGPAGPAGGLGLLPARPRRPLLPGHGGRPGRADSPGYRAKGWDVGSGPTEAGCKVLQGRRKGAGRRWAVAGSEPLGALQALYATGQGLGDSFWAQPQRPAAGPGYQTIWLTPVAKGLPCPCDNISSLPDYENRSTGRPPGRDTARIFLL
jgi:hypothetical protein